MNAISFIQKNGINKAINIIENSPPHAIQVNITKQGFDYVTTSKSDQIRPCLNLDELKASIDVMELIESYGGIEQAQKKLNLLSITRWITPEIEQLKNALQLIEASHNEISMFFSIHDEQAAQKILNNAPDDAIKFTYSIADKTPTYYKFEHQKTFIHVGQEYQRMPIRQVSELMKKGGVFSLAQLKKVMQSLEMIRKLGGISMMETAITSFQQVKSKDGLDQFGENKLKQYLDVSKDYYMVNFS